MGDVPAAWGFDPERVLAEARRRFPGVLMWFGHSTGHLWAMLPDGLVEAATPAEFGQRLAERTARLRTRPRPAYPPRRPVPPTHARWW